MGSLPVATIFECAFFNKNINRISAHCSLCTKTWIDIIMRKKIKCNFLHQNKLNISCFLYLIKNHWSCRSSAREWYCSDVMTFRSTAIYFFSKKCLIIFQRKCILQCDDVYIHFNILFQLLKVTWPVIIWTLIPFSW